MRISMAGRWFGVFLVLSAVAGAETADGVVARYLAARGGAEKIHAIRTLDMTTTTAMMGRDIDGEIFMKRPSKLRIELRVEDKKIIRAFDGKVAWSVFPFHGGGPDPEEMPADEAKSLAAQADIDGPLIDARAKGNAVELAGTEDVEGSPAYRLKVTLAGGDVTTIYIDKETGLRVRETSKVRQQGTEVESDRYFSSYKRVEGVAFPFSVDTRSQGKSVGHVTYRQIRINAPVDDRLFEMGAAGKGGR